ncbi:hypothetical protein PENTCL1PPCAC_28909 [Pristionchus entomophagus]|uniref:Uncharacterized protein n=1 Tax=Pristionchus entomophagus TaxID=358040 RepID=A0AAV5ULE8_9BILA|nr:hypothetical protein PENTCL1PPCAC_28909 [Pristionchus entomophagus]
MLISTLVHSWKAQYSETRTGGMNERKRWMNIRTSPLVLEEDTTGRSLGVPLSPLMILYSISNLSLFQLVESPSSSRRSSQRSDRSKDSITELRREIAAAKQPRPRTVSEGKSLDTLIAEKDQRLADLKRRKQQNIQNQNKRRAAMTANLRKISEQYENSQTVREDDLIFDTQENGFTTLDKLTEAEEEEKQKEKEKAAAEKRRHPFRRRLSKFFSWLCNFRS